MDECQSTIVYERREQSQVLYVIPVSSILGRLPLVPLGETGTIPFDMRKVVVRQQLGPHMGEQAIVTMNLETP